MATTTTGLMTIAEFEKLPDDPHGFSYELRNGEVFKLPFPILEHWMIQRKLTRLLENAAAEAGVVGTEFGFRPVPEYEYRVADVVFISRERFALIPRKGYMRGAPELVVEVLSPSNTAKEMLNKRKLCLENGAREFWVVDIDIRSVDVSTPDGHTVTYKSGQQIPLFFAPGASIAVDAIFAE